MIPNLAEPAGAKRLRQQLANQLFAAGALSSPRWRAFEEVPRHVFIPAFSRRGPDGQTEHLDSRRDPRGWLEAAYHDGSLITQRDQAGAATSSSSQPTVMAIMLEAGRPTPDHYGLTVTTDGQHTLWLDQPGEQSIPPPQ